MKDPQITSAEWRWAAGWSLFVVLLSCVPYLIAALIAPEGWQFAGILVNPYDGNSYLAKIRQGIEGSWLFHLSYTPEPHAGAFIFTFYLALGHLAALFGLSPIWMFHLARVMAGLGLLLVAFRFMAGVTPQRQERRLAFTLILSASGLGWLGVLFGAFPIDLWVPEAFVPYSLYANPHFPLAMALMLIIFQEVQRSTPNVQRSVWVGLAALALALTLPFALLTVWAVLAVFLGWLYSTNRRLPWPQIWLTLSVGLFSAPVIVYDYWVSTTNPILAGWSAQNITSAPPPLDLLLGYGLVGLLALGGGWLIARQRPLKPESAEWLVFWWAATSLILLYLPFDLQRRLITGLHLPLCILAAIGLLRWLPSIGFSLNQRRSFATVVVIVGALGTLFVWALPLLAIRQSPDTSETTALLFIRREEAAAFAWLRENATPGDVVLASPRVGLFIPGQTGMRIFYGHPFETIEAKPKKAIVEAFYRGDVQVISPAVDFIIYGPSERQLGQPKNLADWPVVFSADSVVVYKTGAGDK
ncbi:MAG: hypothetical protein KJ077_24530 [Anaerolineae bacterium]|nr:hypothetical protein [Anaerolineae bacterium]